MTKQLTGFTLFTGGGGADIGMQLAGITPVGGIEYDPEIANVARANGLHVTTADILQCDPRDYPKPDILHASPPCPNFSLAKTNAEETEHDIAMAVKVAEFVEVMKPKYFTLENVYKYRQSKSWSIIRDALYRLGYGFSLDHVNFADLGVPQTRQRMIIRAVRGAFFSPPSITKTVEKWIGWYKAVEDLIPTFEDDVFADWQWDRMPEKYKTLTKTFIVSGENNTGGNLTIRRGDEPCYTLTATGYKRPTRGFMNGRVVRLSTRALARFQTFPDCYKLPEKKTLAGRIIGNAVPSLGYAEIVKQLVS
jgi:DNA (cytosine-5)-methyltransferase 1